MGLLIYTTTQVKNAIDNALNKPVQSTLSIPASGWDTTNKTQTVTATGVTATTIGILGSSVASYDAYAKAKVRVKEQNADSITVVCDTVPTADITAVLTLF